jgi:hypothetical protein
MLPIKASHDINFLNEKAAPGRGPIFEQELLPIFRRRRLDSVLINLGRASVGVMLNHNDNPNTPHGMALDSATGLWLPTWHMAYMANMALISGSNDWKKAQLTDGEMLLLTNNIYPALAEPIMRDHDRMESAEFLIQKDLEQFSWQHFPGYEIGRSLVMYDELLPAVFKVRRDIFKHDPNDALMSATGLGIREHLVMGMCICAQALSNGAIIRPSQLFNATIPSLMSLLTREKVFAYLRAISGEYDDLRKLDRKRNEAADPWYTKHRFNPLQEKPLVRLKRLSQEEHEDVYVAPNFHILMKRVLPGIYWTIHNILEADGGKHRHFREGFGYVFEEYVGTLLKRIDPSTFSISHDDYQFFDWIMPADDGFVLVEAKSLQFNLSSKTYPQREQMVKEEVIPKIVEALVQCKRKLDDVERAPLLSALRGKPLIPCVVVWDVPLVEQGGMDRFIKKTLDDLVQGEVSDSMKKLLARKNIEMCEIEALRKERPVLISIRELELLEGEGGRVSLRSFLEKKRIPQSGGRTILAVEAPDVPLTCPYLDEKYQQYWKTINDGEWRSQLKCA